MARTQTIKRNIQPNGYNSNDRDASLKLIDWFDVSRVRAARIAVIGAGAIGNEVIKNLALLGVGNLYIFDRDLVEPSNLSRSVLFRKRDKGKPKALVAAKAARAINPNSKAFWCVGDLRSDLGVGFLRRMDVVIGGLDNMAARIKLNTMCWNADRPWIDAGISVLNGQVCVYRPGHGACLECYFPKAEYGQIGESCNAIASRYMIEGKVPTTPTMASIVAGVQVQEALKLLKIDEWEGRTLVSRQFTFNGTVGEVFMANLLRRTDCEIHSTISADQIVSMPDVSVKTSSVEELVKAVERMYGKGALLELDFDLAVEIRCPNPCGNVRPIFMPIFKVYKEDWSCANCGWTPRYEGDVVVTHHLGSKMKYTFATQLLISTLADIGVPPFSVLRVLIPSGSRGRSKGGRSKELRPEVYVEPAGETADSFGFQAV